MVDSKIRLIDKETCFSCLLFAEVKLILICFFQRILCSWVVFPIGH